MALLQNVVQRGLGMQPNTSGHSKSLRARARYVLHDDDGDGDDDGDDDECGDDDESLRAVCPESFSLTLWAWTFEPCASRPSPWPQGSFQPEELSQFKLLSCGTIFRRAHGAVNEMHSPKIEVQIYVKASHVALKLHFNFSKSEMSNFSQQRRNSFPKTSVEKKIQKPSLSSPFMWYF